MTITSEIIGKLGGADVEVIPVEKEAQHTSPAPHWPGLYSYLRGRGNEGLENLAA